MSQLWIVVEVTTKLFLIPLPQPVDEVLTGFTFLQDIFHSLTHNYFGRGNANIVPFRRAAGLSTRE